MIQINSELPNCMLDLNNQLNEYDFVLFHLYESDERYREYYLNQRKSHPDRWMIFDNSAYEYFVKGEVLDLQKYFEAICELQPDLFILPDVLMDKEKTIVGVEEFLNNYGVRILEYAPNSRPLAVAQGKTSTDLVDCLKLYQSMGLERVAIPFHNSFFKIKAIVTNWNEEQIILNWHNSTVITEDNMYALGRIKFVRENYDLLKSFIYVHFLGSHDPIEKVFYKEFDSMDTGYPVKCAIEGFELGKEPHKPNVIIDEFLNKDLDKNMINLISHNVSIFRNM